MKLSKIKELLSKISPWPWEQHHTNFVDDLNNESVATVINHIGEDNNTYFIAAAPEIIDQLIKQVEVMKMLLVEVINSGVSFSDERVNYKEIQISCDLLSEIRKVIIELKEKI